MLKQTFRFGFSEHVLFRGSFWLCRSGRDLGGGGGSKVMLRFGSVVVLGHEKSCGNGRRARIPWEFGNSQLGDFGVFLLLKLNWVSVINNRHRMPQIHAACQNSNRLRCGLCTVIRFLLAGEGGRARKAAVFGNSWIPRFPFPLYY